MFLTRIRNYFLGEDGCGGDRGEKKVVYANNMKRSKRDRERDEEYRFVPKREEEKNWRRNDIAQIPI